MKFYLHYEGDAGWTMLKDFVKCYNSKWNVSKSVEDFEIQNQRELCLDVQWIVQNQVQDMVLLDRKSTVKPSDQEICTKQNFKEEFQQETNSGLKQKMKNGWDYFGIRKHRLAKTIAWEVLEAYGKNKCAEAYCLLGDIHMDTGELKNALNEYMHALDCEDKGVQVIWRIILCCNEMGLYEKSKLYMDQIDHYTIQHENSVNEFDPPCMEQVLTKKAEILYNCEKYRAEGLKLLMELVHKNDCNWDALYLYGEASLDQHVYDNAASIALRLLVQFESQRKNNSMKYRKMVKNAHSLFLKVCKHDVGQKCTREALPIVKDSAPAYAFLATILKDCGRIENAIQFLSISVSLSPNNPAYVLNLIHLYEIQMQYQTALNIGILFFQQNMNTTISNCLYYKDIWLALAGKHDCKIRHEMTWKDGMASVEPLYSYEKKRDNTQHKHSSLSNQDQNGALSPIPSLVLALTPTLKSLATPLHQTDIRNENAFYTCITQLCTIQNSSSGAIHGTIDTKFPVVYVCGDSHALAMAWRYVSIHGTTYKVIPKLVTGLKHWHLRESSHFYPKVQYANTIQTIPEQAKVIFLFGEIDCRDGILRALERGRYETLDEGLLHTAKIYIQSLQQVQRNKHFEIYIHPIVPVLNETRYMTRAYNQILIHEFKSNFSNVRYLDFFDQLLTNDGTQLSPKYQLDGTHLHPNYLSLIH